MNGSNEGPCGSDSIYQYSNASVSSSSTTGDVDEAAFLQGGLQRPERILDPTSSGIVLATNASRSDSLYHNEIQHQPSSFTPASFNSTETSLIGISPNGYDDRYFTSVGSPFYDWFPDDFSVLECLTQGDQHLV
jgi:hypothetical protein